MKRVLHLLMVGLALTIGSIAQDKPAEKPREERPLSYYKVEFVLRELQDSKIINSRNYLMNIENGDRGEIKIGARVPVNVGPSTTSQYMDVGVNILCRVAGKEDFVELNTTIEVSSFALPEQASGTNSSPPVLRNMRTQMSAVVPVNKQAVIGSIDDANSTKRYEIAVTATKLK